MKRLRISCEATGRNKPDFTGQIIEQHFAIEIRFEVRSGFLGGVSRALVITMDAKNYGDDDCLRAMLLQRKRVDIEIHSTPEDEGPFEAIEYIGNAEWVIKWLKLDIDKQFNEVENKKLLSL